MSDEWGDNAARLELLQAQDRIAELESRLDELSKLTDHPDHKRDEIYSKAELLIAIDKLVNERNNLSSRLEHYRLALEGIVRMGSDNYGIINESAKAADFALNAPAHDHLVKSLTEPLPAERDIRDNVDLAVNKQFVVETRRPSKSEEQNRYLRKWIAELRDTQEERGHEPADPLYSMLIERIEPLVAADPVPDSADGVRLVVLTELCEAYEKRKGSWPSAVETADPSEIAGQRCPDCSPMQKVHWSDCRFAVEKQEIKS